MPTYEYACKKCGEHIEVVQSFTDDPLTKCPACKGALRKVFGNVGITFKGSGFYKTDSRSTSSSSSTAAKESSSSKEGSSKDTSSSKDSPSPSTKDSSSSSSSGSTTAAAG